MLPPIFVPNITQPSEPAYRDSKAPARAQRSPLTWEWGGSRATRCRASCRQPGKEGGSPPDWRWWLREGRESSNAYIQVVCERFISHSLSVIELVFPTRVPFEDVQETLRYPFLSHHLPQGPGFLQRDPGRPGDGARCQVAVWPHPCAHLHVLRVSSAARPCALTLILAPGLTSNVPPRAGGRAGPAAATWL